MRDNPRPQASATENGPIAEAAHDGSRIRAQPLRMRLLLLAASGLLPLVLVLGWGLDHLIAERSADAQNSQLELSRALATALDSELRSVIALLQHMSTSDELERADLRAFQLTARRTAEQLGWRYADLSDSEGRVLLRTNEPYGTSDPAPGEPHSMVRAVELRTIIVSHVIETPNSESSSFVVRVPVIRSGQLVYVVSAFLPTDRILAVLTRQNIPHGSVAAVFDHTGRRVARSRAFPAVYGSPSLEVLLNRGDSQGVGRTVTLEGIESYTGYTRLPDSRWIVAVGMSVAEANEALNAALRAVAAGLLASLALAVLLAWLLSRRVLEPIETLKDGAAALGRGAPLQLPRLDIEELDDVGLALTAAAADRDRAAAQINDALRTAEEANRSKDQFLAILGHELRNPLAPIATAVQLMALKGDDKTAHERRVIERQLSYVTRLVDDLLDVSRITSGRLTIRHEPVWLAHVLAQVVDSVRSSLGGRALSFEPQTEMENVWVAGDEVRLVQIFSNLLVNAIKFTPAGGSIRVKTAMVDHEVQVDVEDTGIGITRAELERIFGLFYQAPQGSDRARGGLGLGLRIVKSLVEMHGGTVRATSAGPGHGSCFTVRLPLCKPAAAGKPAAPASAATRAVKILVVDDNEDAADTCATFLEIHGHVVRVAYTPEAALDVLREFTPDVAILDIGLPGMSGYALAGRMKGPPLNYRGRLVALTGYGQASDMAVSQAAGFDAHLTKPVSPTDLLELVSSLNSSRDIPSCRSASPPHPRAADAMVRISPKLIH
jgi:signal transduction histidine kinase/ActR/RegA family two-component response regulator